MMELTMALIAISLGAIGFIFGMSSVVEVGQLKRRMKKIEMIYAEDWFENIKDWYSFSNANIVRVKK